MLYAREEFSSSATLYKVFSEMKGPYRLCNCGSGVLCVRACGYHFWWVGGASKVVNKVVNGKQCESGESTWKAVVTFCDLNLQRVLPWQFTPSYYYVILAYINFYLRCSRHEYVTGKQVISGRLYNTCLICKLQYITTEWPEPWQKTQQFEHLCEIRNHTHLTLSNLAWSF